MAESGYQGWANYPTWAVALWIDNDEGMYLTALEIAADWVDDDEWLALSKIADAICEWIEESAPIMEPDMYSDLFGYALGIVEWRELAKHYLEIAREQASDE
jgi:hypothetical protein